LTFAGTPQSAWICLEALADRSLSSEQEKKHAHLKVLRETGICRSAEHNQVVFIRLTLVLSKSSRLKALRLRPMLWIVALNRKRQ